MTPWLARADDRLKDQPSAGRGAGADERSIDVGSGGMCFTSTPSSKDRGMNPSGDLNSSLLSLATAFPCTGPPMGSLGARRARPTFLYALSASAALYGSSRRT
jgi:hypothetical protein